MDFNEDKENKRDGAKKYFASLVFSLLAVIVFFGAAMAILYKQQIKMSVEIAELRDEFENIQLHLELLYSLNREKRDAEASPVSAPDADGGSDPNADGGVPAIYDYAYGVKFNKKSTLSVYPTLQGSQIHQEIKDDQNIGTSDSFSSNSIDSLNQHGANQNYHQLGIMRQVNQDDAFQTPPVQQQSRNTSAYGKRVQAFRLSRVSYTTEEKEQKSQVIPSHPQQLPSVETSTTAVPYKRPQLKSLDTSSDKPDHVSIHLQAKVSVADESSSHLATGLHDSWRISQWSKEVRGSRLFSLEESTGQVKVPHDGLYFVYVQVEYLDNHDVNGYEVFLNNEPFISCVTTTHSQKEKKKHNTCYTAAIVFIQQGGMLHVRDKEPGRYSLLHSTGTFFGVTKLAP